MNRSNSPKPRFAPWGCAPLFGTPVLAGMFGVALAVCLPIIASAEVLGASPNTSAAPFSNESGNYGGIISDPNGSFANSGTLNLQLNKKGRLTGKLLWQGVQYRLKDSLDDAGTLTRDFEKIDDPATTLRLDLALQIGTQTIAGTFQEIVGGSPSLSIDFTLSGQAPDPALSAQLDAGKRVAFIDPPNPPSPSNLAAPEEGSPESDIPGDGFSVITIAKSKKKRGARFVGRLPDNEPYSAGSPLRGTRYSLFSTLYKKGKKSRNRGANRHGGEVFGAAEVGPSGGGSPASLQSQLKWGKRAGADQNYYPRGFSRGLFLDGVKYPRVGLSAVPPIATSGARQIAVTLLLRKGNLEDEIKTKMRISPFRVKVVGDNPNQVRMRIDSRTGGFTGKFIHPVSGEETKFHGAFQPSLGPVPGEGRGNFKGSLEANDPRGLGPPQSGSARVSVNLQ